MRFADEKGLVEYDRPGVRRMFDWLECQPFSLRIITLIFFMAEAVKAEFGEGTMKSFEDDLRAAYRKPPSLGLIAM
jgi:hypothetical protein